MDPLPEIHVEPANAGLPRRYRRIQVIREHLQRLIDKPFDEEGNRLSLRIEVQYHSSVKTAAKDLNIFVKCERYDSKWMKVTIWEPGERHGPGRAPGPRPGNANSEYLPK